MPFIVATYVFAKPKINPRSRGGGQHKFVNLIGLYRIKYSSEIIAEKRRQCDFEMNGKRVVLNYLHCIGLLQENVLLPPQALFPVSIRFSILINNPVVTLSYERDLRGWEEPVTPHTAIAAQAVPISILQVLSSTILLVCHFI